MRSDSVRSGDDDLINGDEACSFNGDVLPVT